ncbi:MAG: glutamine amidotransferase [Rhodothermales bacterium]
MLERFFKFSSLQYAEGALGLQGGVVLALLVAIVGIGVFVAVYLLTKRLLRFRDRAVIFGLRGALLALLCLPLLEPVWITPDVVPDENFVAVVVDGSASMSIPDGLLAETRGADALTVLGADDGLIEGLGDVFKLRYYTFGDRTERVDTLSTSFEGTQTDLTAALGRVLDDFRGIPLSGVVLLSDGGDNSQSVPRNAAQALQARGIPLHVIGLGQTSYAQEREVLDAKVSRGVEVTTGAEIDVKVRSWGAETSPVRITVQQGDEVVLEQTRRLKGEGRVDQFMLYLNEPKPGAEAYTLALEPAPGEVNTQNNTLDLLVDARQDTVRVLYVEGHLRRDFKFIKRALETDQVIEFTSVSRTGTGRFYRQGIRSPGELQGGFANSEEELFAYKAVLLGDVEAGYFSPDQLQLLERFVRARGGGFLMMGGRLAFTEGDYWNTPVQDVLPIDLDLNRRQVLPVSYTDPSLPGLEQGFRFEPTVSGEEHPILKLSPDPAVNRIRWADLPGLTSINFLGSVKPGGLVLAEKPTDDFGASEPLLVVQNYGRGRSAALATSSTWRWQMLMEAEDQRHERFWRQLVRWLVASAPNRVNLSVEAQRYAPGATVPFQVEVFEPDYVPREGARVSGFVRSPSGLTTAIEYTADLTTPGRYLGQATVDETGVYEAEVTVYDADGSYVGIHDQRFLVQASKEEFYDATQKVGLLQELAEVSGGTYYTADATEGLVSNLRQRRTSTSIFEASPLWDMPAFYLLLLMLFVGEWAYRRRRGLP